MQTGHVLPEPKTQEEFDRMKGRLKGAWVLITGKSEGWPVDYSDKANHRRDSLVAANIDIRKKNSETEAENRKAGKESVKKELLPLSDEPALFYKQMKDAGIPVSYTHLVNVVFQIINPNNMLIAFIAQIFKFICTLILFDNSHY